VFDVRSTRAAATILPILRGRRLTLRRALNVVFSREFPRPPMARGPLWAVLKVFWTVDSSPSLGLNATVMVAPSPS
jgi:hypothetical protein